ncbi:MAG: 50S ribosomal protein L29 [Prevotella sp.]|nr:50S ribosomal protein L29 [Prevotella sp.]MCF0208545.1 50S ribosomal protein L29 [Bacteroidaceae bacterium]
MKIQELKELSVKDLTDKLNEAKEAYKKMKLSHAISPLENPAQIKAARRDIARMQTELSLRK